jgi:hypothetical protein
MVASVATKDEEAVDQTDEQPHDQRTDHRDGDGPAIEEQGCGDRAGQTRGRADREVEVTHDHDDRLGARNDGED